MLRAVSTAVGKGVAEVKSTDKLFKDLLRVQTEVHRVAGGTMDTAANPPPLVFCPILTRELITTEVNLLLRSLPHYPPPVPRAIWMCPPLERRVVE